MAAVDIVLLYIHTHHLFGKYTCTSKLPGYRAITLNTLSILACFILNCVFWYLVLRTSQSHINKCQWLIHKEPKLVKLVLQCVTFLLTFYFIHRSFIFTLNECMHYLYVTGIQLQQHRCTVRGTQPSIPPS